MPPKARGAPKPAEFHIGRLQAGRKQWVAGQSGPLVKLNGGFLSGSTSIAKPRKQVLVTGKALFGRERLAFEVQEIDHSPAAVRKLLKKEKELQDARFGPDPFFGFGGPCTDSGDEEQKPVDIFDAFRAAELAAKHSIQVKFQDITNIEMLGETVTLTLSNSPQCYAKPMGEPRIVNMEVVKDFTGNAKTISFTAGPLPSASAGLPVNSKAVDFSEVKRMLCDQSPRLQALFDGMPASAPAVAKNTPQKRKRSSTGDSMGDSSSKQPRRGGSFFVDDIAVSAGTWLLRAVERFGLKGTVDATLTEEQWKSYFKQRVLLELSEVKTLQGNGQEQEEEEEEGEADCTFHGADWPQELGPQPEISRMCFESYRDGPEEREFASDILCKIRESIKATVESSTLQLHSQTIAHGVFLTSYHINDADEGEPRTVNASARIYAPNGTGRYVHLEYENHKRVRMSFTERFSHLHAFAFGPGLDKAKAEKIFDMDLNEHRRKNPVKTSLATNATLNNLGVHLFGAEGAMSNRKLFGLLVRAVGLGQFGESNGWPVAIARRRFKCGKGESATDTEPIAGEECEDADVDGCCVM